MHVVVTVLKAFPYRGREVRAGEVIQMDQIDAYAYQRHGLVGPTLQQFYQTRQLVAR